MIIEPIACFIVGNQNDPDTYVCLYQDGDGPIVYFVITIFHGLQLARIVYKQTGSLANAISVVKCQDFVRA